MFGYASNPTDLMGWKIWKGVDSEWNSPTNWSGNTIPSVMDSILIPNCGCPELNSPVLPSGSFSYASLLIESGGQITIPSGTNLMIDLSGSSFI